MTLYDLMKHLQVRVMTDAKVEVLLTIESVTPNNHSEELEESNAANDWWPKTRDWTTYTVKFTNGFEKEYTSIEEIELIEPHSST